MRRSLKGLLRFTGQFYKSGRYARCPKTWTDDEKDIFWHYKGDLWMEDMREYGCAVTPERFEYYHPAEMIGILCETRWDDLPKQVEGSRLWD